MITYTVQSLQDLEKLLFVLGEKINAKEKLDNEFGKQTQAILATQDKQTQDLTSEIETIEAVIKEYVKNHIEEFRTGKKKSRDFASGSIITKENEAYEYPDDEVLIERIKLHYKTLLPNLVKNQEVPMKQILKALIEKGDINMDLLGICKGKEIKVTIKTV